MKQNITFTKLRDRNLIANKWKFSMKNWLILALLFLFCCFQVSSANRIFNLAPEDTVLQQKRNYNITRISIPPVIDGALNDSCWKLGEWQSNYTQFIPAYKGKTSCRTEIKALYDCLLYTSPST